MYDMLVIALGKIRNHINLSYDIELNRMYKSLIDSVTILQNILESKIKEFASQLKVNRTFLSGYLEALEGKGYANIKNKAS